MTTYHKYMEVVTHWTMGGNAVLSAPAGFGGANNLSDLTGYTTTAKTSTNSADGYVLTVASQNSGDDYGLIGASGVDHTIANVDPSDSSNTEGFALKFTTKNVQTHTETTSAWQVFPTTTVEGTSVAGQLTVNSDTGTQKNRKDVISYGIKTAATTPTGHYQTTLQYTATTGS